MLLSRDHLALAGDTVEVDLCYLVEGAYHFMATTTDSVAIRPDGVGRIRVETYAGLDRVATVGWADATQYDRLQRLIAEGLRSIIGKEAPVGQ